MKNKIISERLLSELTGTNITSVYYHKKHGWKYTTYTERNNGWTSSSDIPLPNIYEIGFKCKEWAYKNGYILVSFFDEGGFCRVFHTKLDDDLQLIDECKTEIESIIKACEWILNNQGK